MDISELDPNFLLTTNLAGCLGTLVRRSATEISQQSLLPVQFNSLHKYRLLSKFSNLMTMYVVIIKFKLQKRNVLINRRRILPFLTPFKNEDECRHCRMIGFVNVIMMFC